MDTVTGNKLIAEFMGGVLKPAESKHPNNPYNKPTWWGVGDRKDVGHFSLHYHTSWDWLMPVVEKIIQIGDVDIDCHNWLIKISTNISSSKSWQVTSHDYIRTMGATMLGAYHFCVIEFIQWYNTHPNTINT